MRRGAGLRGQLLAHELRTARKHHIQIVLVHEQDPERGGCAFDRFFETTPEDLVIDGLYKKIANACHTGPHRDVSLALIIKVMGAVEEQSTWCSRIGLQRKKTAAEAEEHQRTALVPVPVRYVWDLAPPRVWDSLRMTPHARRQRILVSHSDVCSPCVCPVPTVC
jgi:hypothetical protein